MCCVLQCWSWPPPQLSPRCSSHWTTAAGYWSPSEAACLRQRQANNLFTPKHYFGKAPTGTLHFLTSMKDVFTKPQEKSMLYLQGSTPNCVQLTAIQTAHSFATGSQISAGGKHTHTPFSNLMSFWSSQYMTKHHHVSLYVLFDAN